MSVATPRASHVAPDKFDGIYLESFFPLDKLLILRITRIMWLLFYRIGICPLKWDNGEI